MTFDIFISYSNHDNTALDNWVHRFCDKLSNDFRSRSGKKLNIFLDRESLNIGNVLSERLQQALGESRIFLPVLSPTYLASDWCRREFLHFLDHGGALIIEGSSRIVPVRLMPHEHFEPEINVAREVERIAGFLNGNEILYADFYDDPLPIRLGEPEFDRKIAGLSSGVFELLKTVRQTLETPASTKEPLAGAIFLAYTATGSKSLRDGLLTELRHQRKYGKINYQILPDDAPDRSPDLKNLSAVELEAFLRLQMQASAFSIHLFDDLEGPKTPDTHEPIPHLQYRLAKEIATTDPGFRIFTAQCSSDECSALQGQFLQQVAVDARFLPQLEMLPAYDVKSIKDFILEKIQVRTIYTAPATSGDAPRRVFFIHDYRDKDDPIRARIDDLIYEQMHDVYWPVFREDEPHIDPDTSFREFWMVCNKAVVLLRSATAAWCNAVKVELIKTGTEKHVPYTIAVCVTDPDVARRIREVRSHEFRIIDCTQLDYEQQLIQFLNASRHA